MTEGDPPITTTPDIRLLIMDVDGVLTDGSIIIDAEGKEFKRFHVRDGMGIIAWARCGLKTAIITGRPSDVTVRRAAELKIDWVEQCGAMDKKERLEQLCQKAGVTFEQVAYVGDDLADLSVMTCVGYPIAVADAMDEVRQIAQYTTQMPGGRGAVREAIEHLLKKLGLWQQVLQRYGL